jgi:hypothetical protein
MSIRTTAIACLAALLVAGCGMFGGSKSGDVKTTQTTTNPYHTDPGTMDPKDFNPRVESSQDRDSGNLLSSLFGSQQNNQGGGAAGVGVNSFLWRATLDTVSFMPLASADPFGGVIITDWFSPPETPDERFKINVFILGRELRADGVRASVFHQTKNAAGQWAEAPVDANTGTDLENAILTRARQIRLSAAAAQ